jgi:hypothetical protein
MASTYSALKIELIATGEQSGTWGTTTNNNLGNDALGEAITGSADVAFSSADVTITLTDTNASQTARNLRLNLTGTSGGARELILGSGCQIEKLYLINNGLADAVTVKNTTGTGIAVPAGKTMFVYNNGTNVVDAVTFVSGTATSGANSNITSLTGLTTPLSVAQGGTASTTAQTAINTLAGATTSAQYLRGNGSNVVMSAIQAGDVPTLNQNTSGSAATFTSTSQNSQFNSVGVGTAASTTAGEIRATNNVTAFYTSDIKFKENVKAIPNALDKVNAIGGKLFDWTDSYIQERGGEDGYFVKKSDFGVIAQDVQAVFPEAVRVKPDQTLAVDYEKLSALSFAAIKELSEKIKVLENK